MPDGFNAYRQRRCCWHSIALQCRRGLLPDRLHMGVGRSWRFSVPHSSKELEPYHQHLLQHTSGWQFYFSTFRHIWHGV